MFLEPLITALTALGAKVAVRRGVRQARVEVDGLLEVRLDDARHVFALEHRSRPPYPNEVARLEPIRKAAQPLGIPLIVAPYVSEGQGEALVRHGWCWADEQGNFDLRAPGLRLRHRIATRRPPRAGALVPRGPVGLRVIRALMSHPGLARSKALGTTAVARAADVSDARTSQVLAQLQRHGLVERTDSGWAWDRGTLLDAFLAEYRGPGSTGSFFYTLRPLQEVAVQFARRRSRSVLAISADIGPDLLVPVRRPTHLIAYLGEPARPNRHLVRAEGLGDANVVLRFPDDLSVFGSLGSVPAVRLGSTLVPLADPAQMIWDLRQLGGEDRLEAAERLRQWLLEPR